MSREMWEAGKMVEEEEAWPAKRCDRCHAVTEEVSSMLDSSVKALQCPVCGWRQPL